ncbi:MAG: hypothetical protein EXS15_02895 [Phycisphaerales bacterium]|nr:hypothetical protein [Phycisphaerales bacterium]
MHRTLCSLVAGALTLAGCGGRVHDTAYGGIDYPYGPASVIIHPLSQLHAGAGTTIASAIVCIEFMDIDQQTTRATGLLEVMVTPPGQPPIERLINLSDLRVNEQSWDRPTRMYQVQFRFEPPLERAPSGGVAVVVSWTPVDRNAITLRESLMESAAPFVPVSGVGTSARTSP